LISSSLAFLSISRTSYNLYIILIILIFLYLYIII
jgi:hypothetical protein